MPEVKLAIKYNNSAVREVCPLCDVSFRPPTGPWLFLADTWDAVCLGCGKVHAPHLAALVELAAIMKVLSEE